MEDARRGDGYIGFPHWKVLDSHTAAQRADPF